MGDKFIFVYLSLIFFLLFFMEKKINSYVHMRMIFKYIVVLYNSVLKSLMNCITVVNNILSDITVFLAVEPIV